MTNYYNDNDPFAAEWLRELIADGLIPPGDVDSRSLLDVRPSDLIGYTSCHWFAGIGVWPLALRLAGWPDDRPVWTGSEPCQPFSDAGKGLGFADERYLRPYWQHQIAQCRPPTIFGEQVASKDGLAWLDVIQADLEGEGYAFGASDTCAAGFGAPHIRQRLYWVAHHHHQGLQGLEWGGKADPQKFSSGYIAERSGFAGRLDHHHHQGLEGFAGHVSSGDQSGRIGADTARSVAETGCDGGMADADGWVSGKARAIQSGRQQRQQQQEDSGCVDRLANGASDGRREERSDAGWRLIRDRAEGYAAGFGSSSSNYRPSPTNGFWRDADWLHCRDGKWRAVEPGTFPLAHGGAFRNRVAELRGAGNALNLAQAVGFIEAFLEAEAAGFTDDLFSGARFGGLEELM